MPTAGPLAGRHTSSALAMNAALVGGWSRVRRKPPTAATTSTAPSPLATIARVVERRGRLGAVDVIDAGGLGGGGAMNTGAGCRAGGAVFLATGRLDTGAAFLATGRLATG